MNDSSFSVIFSSLFITNAKVCFYLTSMHAHAWFLPRILREQKVSEF